MSRFAKIAGKKPSQLSDHPELPFGAPPQPRAVTAAVEIVASPLDERFAELMTRLNGRSDSDLFQAARLVSAWRGAGHVCLPLAQHPNAGPALAERLLATEVVGRPGDWRPLILDPSGRLYLHRYWQYERQLASAIRSRLAAPPPAVDAALLASGLDALFDAVSARQRTAAEIALTSNFCVVTGGPGTGKTRTVARILALLHAQSVAAGKAPQIALAAPTGKAAARMTESIRQALAEMGGETPAPGLLSREAVTLHQLLGLRPDSPVPRFNASRPLPIDAVIVDEASMVDLALMAKLFAAVPATARIILLGDKDQLASVEAGSVLGDICGQEALPNGAGPRRHIVELRQSFRFAPDSGIYQISASINAGRAEEAIALFGAGFTDVSFSPLPAPDALGRALRERVIDGFRPALVAENPQEALAALNGFRILCAVRQGPYGVAALNRLTEDALAGSRLIAPHAPHYHGRPVMILRNDYTLRLFNGDVGLILRDPEAGDVLRAFFFGQDGMLRRLAPSRLPEHETVWAMTVHKSQGSEFDRVLLVLPDRDSPVLTRELLYTGLTRSKSAIEIWSNETILRAAIDRPTERVSGLNDY